MMKRLVGACVGAAMLMAACGGSSEGQDTVLAGDVELTPQQAVLASADAVDHEHARGAMYMLIDMNDGFEDITLGSLHNPIASIVVAGDTAAMSMDLSVLAPDEVLPFDPEMEIVVDDTALYLRAPMFAAIPPGELGADLAPFAELGDGWGFVDISRFEDVLPEDVAALMGQTNVGFEVYLDVLRTVDEVGAGTPSSVGDVATTRYRAVTTFDEWMLATSGMDVGQIGTMAGDDVDDELFDALLEAMGQVPLELTVDVDAEGRFRQMDMELDMAPMFGILSDEYGEPIPPGFSMTMAMRIVVEEYDSSITVEVPTGSATDLTDAFTSMFEQAGFGTAA